VWLYLLLYFKAYVSYTSVVSVDATHNNPVLNVFIYLLFLEAKVKAQSAVAQELHHSSGKYIAFYM